MTQKKTGYQPRVHAVSEALASQVLSLSVKPYPGLSAEAIARKLGISKRTVFRVRAAGRVGAVAPDPRSFQELNGSEDPEVLACLELSVAGFEALFLRYSGEKYLPEHAKEWIRAILIHDRLLLNVPPRHAKSEILSVWYSIWRICLDRNIQILIISQTVNMARKFSEKIAWHLEYNKRLIQDFGRFKPMSDDAPWRPRSGELMVEGRDRQRESGDLTLQIRGAGQQILGMEADLIIGDDVVDRESAYTQDARDKLSEYWSGDVMSRRSPVSKVIVIGQRIHFLDLYGELAEKTYTRGPLMNQPLWEHVNYPAILDWDAQTVLWPEEWPFERLMETYEDLKRKHNSWLWESMYQQNPIPPEDRLVLDEWIYGDSEHPGCLDTRRRAGESMKVKKKGDTDPLTNEVYDTDEKWVRVVSMDPSPERQAGLIVADLMVSREVFKCGILEATRARMDVREMLRQIERVTEEYHPSYLIFEKNAAQRWFLQDSQFLQWKNRHNVRVMSHTTGINKTDEVYGIQSLAVAFEYGRVRLPWADHRGREMSRVLIDEATTYPYGPYNDLLMSLWFISFNSSQLTPPSPPPDGARYGPGFTKGSHNQGWAAFVR